MCFVSLKDSNETAVWLDAGLRLEVEKLFRSHGGSTVAKARRLEIGGFLWYLG
jgi:hypothetical protein